MDETKAETPAPPPLPPHPFPNNAENPFDLGISRSYVHIF